MILNLHSVSLDSLQIPTQLDPILTQVTCNDDKSNDYAIIGELHILRCPHQIKFVNACSTIQNVVALNCGKEHFIYPFI